MSSYTFELRFKQARAAAAAGQDKLLGQVTRRATQIARTNAPVRTGQFKAGIGYRKLGPGRYEIFATAPHSAYVLLGTRYMQAQPVIQDGVRQAARELGARGLVVAGAFGEEG